jgi:Tfp pilus assembly major pilin PilA
MIVFQVISTLILIAVIAIMYSVAIKLVNEHRQIHSTKENIEDQDNLDLTNKQ